MENSNVQKYVWKDKEDNDIAFIEINDSKGIDIKVDLATLGLHRSEMEELLTLGLYPPRNEDNINGVLSEDGKWITYETKRGQKWELAKVDIVNTFHFWFGS